MHDIHLVLQKLNEYIDSRVPVESLEEMVSNPQPNVDYNVLINNLTEICTECRQTRESNVFDNTHDSWEYFAKMISIKHLIAYFTGLIGLSRKDSSNFLYRKLSITVCQTYLLLLTSPGAKVFDAFQPTLLQKVFKIFDTVKNLSSFKESSRMQLQMAIIMLLEDFKLYLKHVSFKDYEDLQLEFIEAVASIMEYHHDKGFLNKYSQQIQDLCYEMLEHVCLPVHGPDISGSLSLVLNGTACLNKFHRPCSGGGFKPKYSLISDWFIEMLKHYPRQTTQTLTCYIQAIISDADLNANRDIHLRHLDNCAQYDAAMVRICGESIADYVEQVSYSKETQHRVNCVELIGRMLLIDSECNWELFRDQLSTIPREMKLMRILLQKVYDQNNVVSLKGINTFLKVTQDGNKQCKDIIQKCFIETAAQNQSDNVVLVETQASTSEESEEEPQEDDSLGDSSDSNRPKPKKKDQITDYTLSKDFRNLNAEINQNLLRAIKLQLKNNSALVRKATILLLEFIAKTRLNMDELLASWDFRHLYIDQSPLVRRQLVLSLDQILNTTPSNQSAIMAWVKIILDLANDTDQKVMETVMDSFKRNIFDKIQNYETSSSLKHIFPWRLLKFMLNCKDCPDFRISIQKWMNKNLLTAKTLTKIETHLDTNNATEAWILLAMVAPNIQGHNPERVSKLLLQNLKYDMTNSIENCYIQLEVLSFWLKYLNNPSKNEIKRLMTEMLEMGSLKPRNINRAFGICYKLSCKSGEKEKTDFVNCLENASRTYILTNQNSIFVPNLCDDRMISYLYLYSEVGSIMDHELDEQISDFIFKFLNTVADGQLLTIQNDRKLPKKINCIQSVLTGVSSFNQEICSRFVPLLGKILRTIDHIDVCFTAIKCLGYLCKKNTAVVEAVVPYILAKTQHKYANIREFALNTLATLILEDYLKFRGSLLIYILAAMLDPEREIKELAMELIMKYTLEKNDIFLRTCLLECPFVFNGCPTFGQSSSSISQSGNILRGPSKKTAREYIYRYLIKKIEPVYLYMYFGNIIRMVDYIDKNESVATSPDAQAALADFCYVCTEICIANEKQKKNVSKILRETHTGDGEAGDDSERPDGENEAEAAGMADGGTGKGRRGKKNQPTIAQALVTVEKSIPHIVTAARKLCNINDEEFQQIIDKMCTEICIHFDVLLEYAHPREFWSKYQEKISKKTHTVNPLTRKMSQSKQPEPEPSTSRESLSQAVQQSTGEENDSGQFTIDDVQGQNDSRSVKSSSSRRTPSRKSKEDNTPAKSRRRIIESDDSDDDSVISSISNRSRSSTCSTPKSKRQPEFKRKKN